MSVKKSMILSSKRYLSFELFGYDFLLDEDLRTWLIEVFTIYLFIYFLILCH